MNREDDIYKLDKVDAALIKLLMKDGRQSSLVLAKKLGIESSTVRRRINKLVKNDVIRIAALPQPERIGYTVRATIAFDISPDKITAVMEALSKCPEFSVLNITSGRFDIMGLAWFRSNEELYTFIIEVLGKIEGIRDIETFICLDTGVHRTTWHYLEETIKSETE